MQERGKISVVTRKDAGSYLVGDHAASVTELLVDDAYDFEETGGTLLLNDVEIAYTATAGEDTIVLAAPLAADAFDGDVALVSPVASERIAWVVIDEAGAPQRAVVPLEYYDLIPEGTRDPELAESVTIDDESGRLMVAGLDQQIPVRDGSFIDPDTLPPAPPVTPVVPSSSPEPEATGTLNLIVAKVPGIENDTPVEYAFHLATTDAVAPNPATLLPGSPTTQTGYVITALPDGTALEYDVDYYVAVVASSGGLEAAPSSWVLARLNRAGTPDIAVGAVTAAQISAIVTLSNLFRTAETGQRIEFDNAGIRIYNSTGAIRINLTWNEAYLDVDRIFARNLETAAASLGGLTKGAAGGEFRMGIGTIEAPQTSLQHQSVPVSQIALGAPLPGAAAFTDDAATYLWRAYPGAADPDQLWVRRNAWAGVNLQSHRLLLSGGPDLIHSGAASDSAMYVAGTRAGVAKVWRSERPTGTTFGAGSTAAMPAAPGTGGYAVGEPIIGVQRTTGDVLLAHRVQGAQTISGDAYGSGEVMVRKYTPSVASSTLTLTLTKTIKTGQNASGRLTSILADNTSGTFDMPASTGKTALVLGVQAGVSPFGLNQVALLFANTGAQVGVVSAGGASAWYDDNGLGALWDGTAFWTTDATADAIRKYANSAVLGNDIWHTYTYWNGTQQSQMATPFKSVVRARYVSTWTIPPLPVGVTQVRLYMSSSEATRTRYERVGTYTGTAGQPLLIQANPIAPPAGTATNSPPATSNFPGGNAHKITDAAGLVEWLNGQGTGVLQTERTTRRTQAGKADTTTANGTSIRYVDVTFPTAFASAPIVVATVEHPSLFASVSSITTTGCRVSARLYSGTTTSDFTIHWLAKLAD